MDKTVLEAKIGNGKWVKQAQDPKLISPNVHLLHVGKNGLHRHPEIMASYPIRWALQKRIPILGNNNKNVKPRAQALSFANMTSQSWGK